MSLIASRRVTVPPTSANMRRLIAGCGYLGSRVARLWQARGDEVHVLTRSPTRAGHFGQLGWHAWVGDLTRPDTLPQLPPVDTVLWSVGFEPDTSQSVRAVKVAGLEHLLQKLPGDQVGRLIHVSSTGVYAQSDGSLVDELTECRPARASAQAAWEAEQRLCASRWADRTVILRLAGIYGPHRLPRLRQLVAGQPIGAGPTDLLNLIHVDDAVQVIQRVADCRMPQLPRVFLVADGHSVERAAFYAEAARLWHTPPPVFGGDEQRRADRHRTPGNKRINNHRMRAELGITLRYPSYREGLAAIRSDSQRQEM